MFRITFFPSPPFLCSFVILLYYYYYFLYNIYNIIRRRETRGGGRDGCTKVYFSCIRNKNYAKLKFGTLLAIYSCICYLFDFKDI